MEERTRENQLKCIIVIAMNQLNRLHSNTESKIDNDILNNIIDCVDRIKQIEKRN